MRGLPLAGPSNDGADCVPLVVDIDALLDIDTMIESVMALLRERPRVLFRLPGWVARGRLGVSTGLAQAGLPLNRSGYSPEVLDYLQAQKRAGRRLGLLAGKDTHLAQAVGQELRLFDEILTRPPSEKHGGCDRASWLQSYGAHGYDYLGSCRGETGLWSNAHAVLPVAPSKPLLQRLRAVTAISRVFASHAGSLRDYLEALRPLHWIKNLLLLVPIGAAHHLPDARSVGDLLLACVAFSLCCSSVYLLNDLLDLQADRQRRDTRERPLASGRVRPAFALMGCVFLLVLAFVLGSQLPLGFVVTMAAYYLLNCLYSMRWKQVAVLDVLILAAGYVPRVVAGAYVVGIPPSAWLIALCVFLFLSLALVKRYAELVAVQSGVGEDIRVRGYLTSDAYLLAVEGIASGYVAVLVLALYTNTAVAHQLYARHQLFWLICLLLLYWINYLWLMARRGRLPHDPVIFALKDRTSRLLLLSMAAGILCAL